MTQPIACILAPFASFVKGVRRQAYEGSRVLQNGVFGVKKGKKMPAIELEGHSEARFELVDGKIVRIETQRRREDEGRESRLPGGPGRDR